MCSIIGSTSIEKVRELAELNEYRGTHSHSLFALDDETGVIVYRHRGFGPLDVDQHVSKIPENSYIIAHQQAPTTENKTKDFIHPAEVGGTELLWHNGIIKAAEIKRLQELLQCSNSWDTFLLLRHFIEFGNVNNIDGTFSCVCYHDGQLFIFRNEISPLFIDNKLNISSTKFENSKPVPPNKIFKADILLDHGIMRDLEQVGEFTTKENPYFFGV